MIFTQKEKFIFLDSFCQKKKKNIPYDLPLAKFVQKHKRPSVLFSKYGRAEKFLAGESHLYFSQEELRKIRNGEKVLRATNKLDSVYARRFLSAHYSKKIFIYSVRTRDSIYEDIRNRYTDLSNYIRDLFRGSVQGVGVVRMWNISIVGALIFGMFLMTMIYRYLGQGAAANSKNQVALVTANAEVLGADAKNNEEEDKFTEELLKQYQEKLQEGRESGTMEKEIKEMVKGYPIEKMVPYIAKKDKVVAAFLVGIAKKESDWGKHVPVLDGQDCYNYWGYRGKRDRMGTGGHTCFDSPQDAVDTVAKRLEFLVSNEKINTPGKMVTVWKCGYDCSWDDPKAVKKWISDVDTYFKKFNDFKE